MRAHGRCTPPIALILFACAPLSIIGQHAKGIGAIEGAEHFCARMFLILDVLGGRQCKCRPFETISLGGADAGMAFLPFKRARAIVRKLKLGSTKEWQE